jgi:hypothetical protein
MTKSTGLDRAEKQYADLMSEARARLEAIEMTFKNRSALAPITVRDFGYIELRMLCELISLACLVAHGHLPGTKTKGLRDEWRASKIIDALDKLHSDFFPRASIQRQLGPNRYDFRVLGTDAAMSKKQLKKLYVLCGDRLHRGDLTQLNRFTERSLQKDFDEIIHWTNEIKKLMARHAICLLDGKTRYFCSLWVGPGGRQLGFLRAVKDQ